MVKVLHNLSMWTAVEKTLTYEQLAAAADNAKKDLHMVCANSIYMYTVTPKKFT